MARRGALACVPARPEHPLNWPTAPDDQVPRIIGEEFVLNHPVELERGVMMPVQIYPIFESADPRPQPD